MNWSAAEDVQVVEAYFHKLLAIINEHGVVAQDIWNMDETGFRIGIGKDQMIVTKRKRAHYFSMPENRESATAIEAISAGGEVCPAFLILSGQVIMSHYILQASQDPRAAIAVTPTGYTNDELAMQWIKHFNKHTQAKQVGKKRLLLVDGHGSHHTKEFIRYCDENSIVPFGMPPHMTHLLQPLDVVVFQPLKHYYAKELDYMVRDGLTNITKVEFLAVIEGVRKKAFTNSTILSAFKKAGISPFNPVPILEELKHRCVQRTPSPLHFGSQNGYLTSSPFSIYTPVTIRQVNKVANKVEKALVDSPAIDDGFKSDVLRLIRSAQSNTAELIQVKKDLGRTQFAQRAAAARRAQKNQPLQSGGVLTVEEGRRMVVQKEVDREKEALRIVEAAEKKRQLQQKRWAEATAKLARRWYMTGILPPAVIFETGFACRSLRRF
jgi:hypothetical protein